MKKNLLILSAVTIIGINRISAQTNLNFENWTGNEPNGWESSNAQTTQSGGAQTVFKETSSPGQGSSSVKMVTGSCPECPNYSAFGPYGPVTPLPNPLGGGIDFGPVSYTQRPVSVDFKYKSNPVGNDAGAFSIELTRYNPTSGATETIGEGYFEAGTVVTNWTNINLPIVYYSALMPDTIKIWANSSIGSFPDLTSLGMPPLPFSPPTPAAGSTFYLDAVNINLPSCAGFSVSVTGTNETSVGAMDGTALASPVGGTQPFSFSWSNLAATAPISGLIPALYSVTVMDGNGCVKVGSYNVLPFSCGAFSVSVTGTNATSFTAEDGSASAAVTGLAGPYTYLWNTGATTPSISGLRLGAYAVEVTAGSGNCVAWGYFPTTAPTGIDNLKPANTLVNVFPNPSTGVFTVDLNSNEKTTIQIYNLMGKLVYAKETSMISNAIDLSSLAQGVYSLKVVSEKSYGVKQIVITK